MLHSDRVSDTPIHGVNTGLAQDHLPVFHELLRKFGKVRQIDLWLYTRGGDMNVPWPLLNAISNYTERVEVLVPFRAHSAGTLIAMGAHQIVMSPSAELSPVDPTTANQFNPRDPNNPQSVLGISVEEVTAFVEMAKESIGIEGSSNVTILQTLAKDISPIALGNVHRTYTQVREVSKKLLGLHMDIVKEETRVNDIIDKLTKKLYSHLHLINRREAQNIGLDVIDAKEEEDAIMWNIYQDYANELELNAQFNIRGVLGTQLETELKLKGGYIETTDSSYVYESTSKVTQASELPEKILTGLIQGRQARPRDLIPGLPVRVDVAIIRAGWRLAS
ncbi:MAG: hypothetical protein DDT32_02177 [Syntrophomonadaceae bacterium]|nr:hypothetical protein [Bacillota bacterium]